MIAAAQVGEHNEKRMSWGQAIIIDPWGKVLASAPSYDDLQDPSTATASPCIVTARLDLAQLREVREKMPVTVHRRRDLFNLDVRA